MSTQDKQRTNIEAGRWPRCRDVTLRDGVLHCELDFTRTYILTEAYKHDPHVQFADAETDQQLIAFARKWGPPFLNPVTPGVMDLNFSKHRDGQRCFRALVALLDAFKQAEGEREALLNFIAAEYGFFYCPPDSIDPELHTRYRLLRDPFRIEGNIADWVGSANLQTVRAATDYLIPRLLFGPNIQLVSRRAGKRSHLEADWNIYDLEGALQWMVWYDEFTKHPIICCAECRKVFRGETARPRKYCSPECGHRATAREAMRKKRAAERAERN
jgi:Zn-finger nucleic acid-binding protein